MKKLLAYLFYFVVVIATTYVFQWILLYWISGVRFYVADGPPGDISFVFSVFHFIFLRFIESQSTSPHLANA
ncbi:hypothetical protein [Peribacillus loiseleuriae]|uniref:hypothetical protein n=1 Tax=Peribacillus loiseleuriae TaxID=1679170 RepID=UPI003D02EB59